MIDKAIVYQVKTYNPEWWNKCEERQASCLLCKHTFQIMAWRERQMHLCRTLLEGQSLLFSTCRQKSFEMSILFIFWWLPLCPDLSTTSYLSSEPWSLLINHLAKTPPVQVGFNPWTDRFWFLTLRKHKFHYGWLLWQCLHLCQRISDCQLLSFGQHDWAGHLRTWSQLCWKLLSFGSLTLSLGKLYRRL